jgi:hypothetical protein
VNILKRIAAEFNEAFNAYEQYFVAQGIKAEQARLAKKAAKASKNSAQQNKQ